MAFSLHSMLLKNPITSPEDRAEADATARLLNDNLDRLRALADAVRFNWRHPNATPAWRAKAVHAIWKLKRLHHASRSVGWNLPLYHADHGPGCAVRGPARCTAAKRRLILPSGASPRPRPLARVRLATPARFPSFSTRSRS